MIFTPSWPLKKMEENKKCKKTIEFWDIRKGMYISNTSK